MCIDDRSSHSTPTVGKDAGQGHPEVEIPDRSSMRIPGRNGERGPYRSREERGWEGATYDEIGAALGVTRQRVIQIEREALRKLKHAAENLMRVKQVKYDWKPGEED